MTEKVITTHQRSLYYTQIMVFLSSYCGENLENPQKTNLFNLVTANDLLPMQCIKRGHTLGH